MRNCASIVLLALAGAPAYGHHSTALIYDRGRITEAEGTIIEVLWANPHVRFKMRGAEPGGEERVFTIESNSVSTVSRFGLTADLVAAGTRVKLAGNPGRTLDDVLWVTNMLLPSGAEILFGSGIAARWSQQTIGTDIRGAVATATDRSLFRVWTNVTFPPSFWGTDLPLTPAAQAARAAFDPIGDQPTANCAPKGMPFIMEQPYPMQIVDAGDEILLRMEEYDTVRHIAMTSEGAGTEGASTRLGRSTGHWEGDTLVVATTKIDYPWFNGTGIPLGPNAAIDETFTLSSDGSRIDYTMTVTDPATFTSPVTLRKAWEFRPGEEVRPYDCRL
jgi:hypothetical protein